MTSAEATFQPGDTVVYAMHGTGCIHRILTRMSEGRPRCFYQIVLDKHKGDVLVPVEEAAALGLRHVMQAADVPQALRRLQQPASLPLKRVPVEDPYLWCKKRLRGGGVLGLAEVRRFLHDFERLKSITSPQMRQLRAFVYSQFASEIAQALGCSQAAAKRLIETALTSQQPVALPNAVEPGPPH